MSVEVQADLAREFVDGVVEGFGFDADTSTEIVDDTIRVDVAGENLGLLIGPRGATVEALQELTRTVVQRHSDEQAGRLVVDVAGYRSRRAAALRQFTQRVAAEVSETGVPQSLEPMSPPDRKVVHDTVNEIDGVRTSSEGEGPQRYVVIHPDADVPAEPEAHAAEESEEKEEPGSIG